MVTHHTYTCTFTHKQNRCINSVPLLKLETLYSLSLEFGRAATCYNLPFPLKIISCINHKVLAVGVAVGECNEHGQQQSTCICTACNEYLNVHVCV